MYNELPKKIYSGEGKSCHVQGIAIDTKREYIYYSFTTMLVKTDLQGNLIGSVDGLMGHLGCLDFNDEDGRVYGSLEYKNDAIGKGILDSLHSSGQTNPDAFYIAIFDVSKINRVGMDAEKDGIMTTVYLKEVVEDYTGKSANGTLHRYGCSGIDGLAFGPEFGKPKDSKKYLNVAYGVYSDLNRTDNDYQVILRYDHTTWKQYEKPLSQNNMHQCGPEKPDSKYFIYTGNTSWGVQNLEYDGYTGNWLMAVYRGQKPQFPNHPLYIIDGSKPAKPEKLKGFENSEEGLVLSLLEDGIPDAKSGVYGWEFEWGSTGLFSLDNGYFYISHQGHTPEGNQFTNVHLYRWTGTSPNPFEMVE